MYARVVFLKVRAKLNLSMRLPNNTLPAELTGVQIIVARLPIFLSLFAFYVDRLSRMNLDLRPVALSGKVGLHALYGKDLRQKTTKANGLALRFCRLLTNRLSHRRFPTLGLPPLGIFLSSRTFAVLIVL